MAGKQSKARRARKRKTKSKSGGGTPHSTTATGGGGFIRGIRSGVQRITKAGNQSDTPSTGARIFEVLLWLAAIVILIFVLGKNR